MTNSNLECPKCNEYLEDCICGEKEDDPRNDDDNSKLR